MLTSQKVARRERVTGGELLRKVSDKSPAAILLEDYYLIDSDIYGTTTWEKLPSKKHLRRLK